MRQRNASYCSVVGLTVMLCSGCGMALKLADAKSTSHRIEEAGNKVTVEQQVVSAQATLKISEADSRSGVMTLHLKTDSSDWPEGVQVSSLAFRSYVAGAYFNYIDFDSNGSVKRITRESASNVTLQALKDGREIRFHMYAQTNHPYQLGVFLTDRKGTLYPLSVRPVVDTL